MSSTMAQAQQQKSKKKFGQNLNKMIPVASKEDVKAAASSNAHGLLLLSGSRKSGTGTHDALLLSTNAQQQNKNTAVQDAWGVVKQQQPLQAPAVEKQALPKQQQQQQPAKEAVATTTTSTVPSKNEAVAWDDYGGRGGDLTNSSNRVLETKEYTTQRTAEIKMQQDIGQKQQSERTAARLRELEAAAAAPVVRVHEPATTAVDAQHVIHLTSYEDRDRGEQRSSTSTPRMLYDPKSGSMVAVNAESTKKKNERKPRKQQPPPQPTAMLKRTTEIKQQPVVVAAPPKNKRGGRKDVVAAAPVGDVKPEKQPRGRSHSSNNTNTTSKRGAGRNNSNSARTSASSNNRRSRGGRNSRNGARKDEQEDVYNNGGAYGVALYTGFENPQALERTGMQQHYYAEEQDDGEEEVMPVFEVLKADDKIELLTGEDDSPTLKPTAKAFAPSQAALAAAAAARSDAESDKYHDTDDDEEDDDGPLGLGFDPTHDMDGLMRSPIVLPEGDLHGDLDLDALTLDPPLNKDSDNGPRHIFAFGSSGTWGDAQVHSSSDWDVPVGIGGGGLFGGSDSFGLAKNDKSKVVSESFLNMPTGSAGWGGFGSGGISATDNQKTGD